jgi:magnesium transporter
MITAWIADAGGARPAGHGEALAAWSRGASVWLDFDCEDRAAVTEALRPLGIHPLVVEDMVMETNRPKVDNYGGYLYRVVHSARWDGERPALRELDLVIGERFLISYHDGETRSVMAARESLAHRPEWLWPGPAPLLHTLLDVLVDHYLPIADRISDEIDTLEDQIFAEQDRGFQGNALRVKRGLAALRRIVGPQRDTLLALTRDEFRPIPAEIRPYLRDVYDRLARISDLLESYRDETSSLLELHVSVTSNRLNEVIKRLTVIATVGLPLGVVTGYYGMNFALPEYRWPGSEWYALGLLLTTGAATWGFLRWKKWL